MISDDAVKAAKAAIYATDCDPEESLDSYYERLAHAALSAAAKVEIKP